MHVAIIMNNFIFFANIFKRFMMLDPILLGHIKMWSKIFEVINKELRIKPKLSTKLIKTCSFNKGLNAIILIIYTWLFTFVDLPIFSIALNSFKEFPFSINLFVCERTHRGSIEQVSILSREPCINIINNYIFREPMVRIF